jgi:hypothetical protein
MKVLGLGIGHGNEIGLVLGLGHGLYLGHVLDPCLGLDMHFHAFPCHI